MGSQEHCNKCWRDSRYDNCGYIYLVTLFNGEPIFLFILKCPYFTEVIYFFVKKCQCLKYARVWVFFGLCVPIQQNCKFCPYRGKYMLWDVIYSGIFYRVCCQSSTFCIFLTTQILVKKVFFILFSKFFISLLNKQRELYLINYLNIHLLLKLYQTLLPKNLSREERDWSKYLRCSSSKVSDAFL